VTVIETLSESHVADVVARVTAHQRDVHGAHPMIAGDVDSSALRESLLAGSPVALAVEGDRIRGHLRGAVLASEVYGRSAWMGPGDVSYDSSAVLDALYVARADEWIADGVRRHYVWVTDDEVEPWLALGFAYMHARGTRQLGHGTAPSVPFGYEMRRGSLDDLDDALALDDALRDFQEQGPSYALDLDTSDQRSEWIETLEDPETDHAFVTYDGSAVAQAATFPLPPRLGTYPDSVHLSAVSVLAPHRGRGVGRALVETLLQAAAARGARYAETNWRITNRVAADHWAKAGFTRTYVRLHRAIGVG
jgi:GNAT superfamily N-acetyltransferase